MICTVTFNPSLDYIVSVDDFQLGMTNRTSSELILPGGKGRIWDWIPQPWDMRRDSPERN